MPEFTHARDKQTITLGSGKNYILPADPALTDPDEIIKAVIKPENEWGYTKNGASVTISPTYYNVFDDLRRIDKQIMTGLAISMTLGLITIGNDIILPLLETAREVPSEDGETVVIGGIENASGQEYFFGFEHIDNENGNKIVVIKGKNNGELQIAFQPETETILNPTLTASPFNDAGDKLIYRKRKPQGAE